MKPIHLLFLLTSLFGRLSAAEPIATFAPDARILFQGESMTDGNRGRGGAARRNGNSSPNICRLALVENQLAIAVIEIKQGAGCPAFAKCNIADTKTDTK